MGCLQVVLTSRAGKLPTRYLVVNLEAGSACIASNCLPSGVQPALGCLPALPLVPRVVDHPLSRCLLSHPCAVCQQLPPGLAVAAALGPGRPQRDAGGPHIPARLVGCTALGVPLGGLWGLRVSMCAFGAAHALPFKAVLLPLPAAQVRNSSRSLLLLVPPMQAATGAGCRSCAESCPSSTAARCGRCGTVPQVRSVARPVR